MRLLIMLLLAAVARAQDWVEVDKLWMLDAARDRNLGMKVYHPAQGAGPWPVIVFSHGLGGSQWGYGYLGSYWAAHGYVSIHCTHPGSDWLLWDGQGMRTGLGNLRKALVDPRVYADRPLDLSFILDHLGLLEEKVPALAGRLDRTRVAVAGHSLGAHTALAMVGLRADGRGADPRPRACLALSPPGPEAEAPGGSGAGIARPVLAITGSDDEQPLESGHGLEWRLETWAALPPGGKYLLVIPGAKHLTFAAGGMGVRADPAHLDLVQRASTAFWDAWLRGDGSSLAAPSGLPAGSRWESRPAGR